MKTKIVPVNRGSYYALEERNSAGDKSDSNDNELVRTVGRGLVPFLMCQMEVRPTLKSLFMTTDKEVTPTKEELFSSYFDFMFPSFDIQPDLSYRPTDEELKSMFRPIHTSKELEEFAALPDDLKQEHRGIFNEYISWLNPSLDQTVEEKALSCKTKAIYMLMVEANGKDQFKFSKSRVLEFVARKWTGNNFSVYNEFRKLQSETLDRIKQDFPKDYKSAQGLYLKEYPD